MRSSDRLGRAALWIPLLVGLGGCDGCDRKQGGPSRAAATAPQCTSPADCAGDGPCSRAECVDGACEVTPLPEGTRCDNDSVCDGRETCSADGRCLPGAPPKVDDGDPCTMDACDPVHGVTHQPVPVDDFDACTEDACDPITGAITHRTIDLDDGDDCTFDSCDPKTGVQHHKPSAFYTCEASCGEGFHVASRAPSAQCAAAAGVQTFCVPSCGDSFHTLQGSCPPGYHTSSRREQPRAGEGAVVQLFCQKSDGEAFYTCDTSCPAGYRKESEARSQQCGAEGRMIRCSQ